MEKDKDTGIFSMQDFEEFIKQHGGMKRIYARNSYLGNTATFSAAEWAEVRSLGNARAATPAGRGWRAELFETEDGSVVVRDYNDDQTKDRNGNDWFIRNRFFEKENRPDWSRF